MSAHGGALSILCRASADLGADRGAMPIAFVEAPVSGHWEAQVHVRLAVDARDVAAGLTITDQDGDKPDMLFGLDRWSGA